MRRDKKQSEMTESDRRSNIAFIQKINKNMSPTNTTPAKPSMGRTVIANIMANGRLEQRPGVVMNVQSDTVIDACVFVKGNCNGHPCGLISGFDLVFEQEGVNPNTWCWPVQI
jgi:hypothetical protein